MEKTKKDKPQLCRSKENRKVNKRDEREGRKILKEHQSQREVQRSWHTYDSLFHSLRPSLSLNIFSFPLFFPPSLPSLLPTPPCLSVLLFVIWPSRSFKSASPFPPTHPSFPVSLPLAHKLSFTISVCDFDPAHSSLCNMGTSRLISPFQKPLSASFLGFNNRNVAQHSHQCLLCCTKDQDVHR